MNAVALLPPVLDGAWRLTISGPVGEPAPDPEAVVGFLRDLSGVSHCGGFSQDGPGGSDFRVIRFGTTGRETLFADLVLSRVDVRMLRCVEARTTVSASVEAAPEVRLSAEGAGPRVGLPPVGVVGEASIYPERRARLGFALETDTGIASRSRRLVVTFPHPLTREDLHRLGDWVAPWGAVLDAGGFVLPNDAPEETLNTYAGVQLFERDSAEIVIDRFESSEEAFDILLNMLDAYSARVDRISLVEQF